MRIANVDNPPPKVLQEGFDLPISMVNNILIATARKGEIQEAMEVLNDGKAVNSGRPKIFFFGSNM